MGGWAAGDSEGRGEEKQGTREAVYKFPRISELSGQQRKSRQLGTRYDAVKGMENGWSRKVKRKHVNETGRKNVAQVE